VSSLAKIANFLMVENIGDSSRNMSHQIIAPKITVNSNVILMGYP
jgi:hypothetical protein